MQVRRLALKCGVSPPLADSEPRREAIGALGVPGLWPPRAMLGDKHPSLTRGSGNPVVGFDPWHLALP
eukprot:15468609-Alexandrium_andersonii.AAC.1